MEEVCNAHLEKVSSIIIVNFQEVIILHQLLVISVRLFEMIIFTLVARPLEFSHGRDQHQL